MILILIVIIGAILVFRRKSLMDYQASIKANIFSDKGESYPVKGVAKNE